jgi:uncharacterized membrane protein YfcA
MERLVQILDDLDDLISSIGLIRERIRKAFLIVFLVCVSVIFQVAGVLLALRQPALALSFALLLFVALLYQAVTSSHEAHSTGLIDRNLHTP